MATSRILKPYSKWFSNKISLKLNLHRFKSKSSSSSPSPSSPMSLPSTPKATGKLYSNMEDELKEVFCHFDGDGDEKISALELRDYFGSIGEYVSHEEAQGVIDVLDSDGDNLLNFQDFMRLMKREGSGCITPKGLQRMLNRLGDDKSYDECVAMIQVFDSDGNGVLDFNEFHQMMAA
ncbi:EF hand calcium-binding family protein [Quillaja saponaria]|uniref:EF hand calcium-binding family protein n=1 Tax=Quillaja saponaria TaxID=32244 RepID=A0AAD7KQW3_QUISA|nr:EF hand calcium-binding family protein [Quillaja saponaria]